MSYDTLADQSTLEATAAKLKEHGLTDVFIVENGAAALEKIKALIPASASVMNGASKTLEQIGYLEYLQSGRHSWKDWRALIAAEPDDAKRDALRRESATADYYLGSVHALSQTGEFIIASNTGSQLPYVTFTSLNPIFVVGAQKLVPTLAAGMKRLEEYVVPLENENMQQQYGMGTVLSKILIFKRETPMAGRSVRMIIVKEALGF